LPIWGSAKIGRHTFASLHILRGCDPKWLQQQMGHATIGITYDIYGNWFRRTGQAAASALGAALLCNDAGNTGTR